MKLGSRPMKISRNVKEGMLVVVRGDKYIRCGKRGKPVGVWTGGSYPIVTYQLDGSRVVSSHPSGVVVSGAISVDVSLP